MTFSQKLKTERIRLGLTQVQAAALLDVPARTYWGWEYGEVVPSAITQEGAMARMLAARPTPKSPQS